MGVDLILYSLSIVFLFRILLYALGEPHTDMPNKSAILFVYSSYLAKKALVRLNQFTEFEHFVNEQNKPCSFVNIEQKRDLQMMIFQNGKKYFTWELVCGMCGVCTFFWISLIFILVPNLSVQGLFMFSLTQIINKILIKWI